jgi:hypothetical protein
VPGRKIGPTERGRSNLALHRGGLWPLKRNSRYRSMLRGIQASRIYSPGQANDHRSRSMSDERMRSLPLPSM